MTDKPRTEDEKKAMMEAAEEVQDLIVKLRGVINDFVLTESKTFCHNSRVLMGMRAVNAVAMDYCVANGMFLREEIKKLEVEYKAAQEKVKDAPQNP